LWSFVECGSSSATSSSGTELAAVDASSSSSSTTKTATSTSSAASSTFTKCDKDQQWAYQQRCDPVVASVCADKIAKFEKRHPELKADFRRMSKRAQHQHLVRAGELAKRSEKYYCIVAQDHIDDMEARAIAGVDKTTFGDYTSLKLTTYDKSSVDDSQRWILTQAS